MPPPASDLPRETVAHNPQVMFLLRNKTCSKYSAFCEPTQPIRSDDSYESEMGLQTEMTKDSTFKMM